MKVAYNITFVVESGFVDRWHRWMRTDYLPKVMESGCFQTYRFHKLIGMPEKDEPTYHVQLIANNKEEIKKYQSQFERDHIEFTMQHFKNQVLEFRTMMVLLEEG